MSLQNPTVVVLTITVTWLLSGKVFTKHMNIKYFTTSCSLLEALKCMAVYGTKHNTHTT